MIGRKKMSRKESAAAWAEYHEERRQWRNKEWDARLQARIREKENNNRREHEARQLQEKTQMPNGTFKPVTNRKTLMELSQALIPVLEHAQGIDRLHTEKRKKVDGEYDSVLASLPEATRKKVEADLKTERQNKLAAAFEETAEVRANLKAKAASAHEAIKMTRDMLANPIAIAEVHNIGSDRRANIAKTMEGIGIAALANMCRAAMASSDKDLASECVRALEKMDKRHRPFPAKQIAAICFKDDVEGVEQTYADIDLQLTRITETLKRAEGEPGMTANQKIAFGQKHEGQRVFEGDAADEESNPGVTATGKIAAGLAAMNAA